LIQKFQKTSGWSIQHLLPSHLLTFNRNFRNLKASLE
jgi:hypothetical protein